MFFKKLFQYTPFVIIIACFCFLFLTPQTIATSHIDEYYYFTNFTVVIDAGHGEPDGGAIGKQTNIKESDLNLKYSRCLESYLKAAGFNVVQTRTTENGLHSTEALGFKKQDMLKRKEIINNAKPNLIISLHMNKFSMENVSGAQVFYQEHDVESEKLAKNIQHLFIEKLKSSKTLHLSGDYFICKCFNCPSVIVECGFLSNAKEEQLLITEEYMDKVCYNIFCGIIKYLC